MADHLESVRALVITPFVQDADFTLLNCDVLDGLRSLEAGSVHCVVTSPPYWGLRDYGTGEWEGGDQECDHAVGGQVQDTKAPGAITTGQRPGVDATTCRKCGARRVDQQLGLEPTPDLYVARMVEVFREVRRVLRDDGTCWLNLGDSYISQGGSREGYAANTGQGSRREAEPQGRGRITSGLTGGSVGSDVSAPGYLSAPGLKQKDLCGIPWRVAFALQADGWYLRSDIIWAKPNPMPESVTDRPTKSHEYVFLLSKQPRYFFDQEAVREPSLRAGDIPGGDNSRGVGEFGVAPHAPFNGPVPAARNVRSVWDIATQPYPEAHFATYPEELVRRCVLAGTSERGCCPVCGKPWEREVEVSGGSIGQSWHDHKDDTLTGNFKTRGKDVRASQGFGDYRRSTLGWHGACEHYAVDPWNEPLPISCTVLDPFLGSGTTAYVARKHGRRSIGIELNPDYCALAARRMQQQSLFAEVRDE